VSHKQVTTTQEGKNMKREPRVGEGRPTKYNDTIIELAQKYIKDYKTEYGHPIPSVVGFSVVSKIAKSTLYKWAQENEEFSDTLKEINANQELASMNGGMTGDFNSTITKLVLANFGYSEKTETKTQVTFENLSDEELKLRIQSLLQ
jgi:hypothetical protein